MSQTTKVTITWNGDRAEAEMRATLQAAVEAGAHLVRNEAIRLLGKEGTAVTTPHGIGAFPNGNKPKDLFDRGMGKVTGLKVIKLKKTTLAFGGQLDNQSRIYWNEYRGMWTQSSPPGSPPYKQTGHLQTSIGVQIMGDGLSARIGPRDTMVYGRIQELGGKAGPRKRIKLPPRPYMKPAFRNTIGKITDLIRFAASGGSLSP